MESLSSSESHKITFSSCVLGDFYFTIMETITEYRILSVYFTKVKVNSKGGRQKKGFNHSRAAERFFLFWRRNVRKKKRLGDYLCGISYLGSTLNASRRFAAYWKIPRRDFIERQLANETNIVSLGC